jgi:two-component system phosphate regulon sensor histidine kinase PhoR
VVGAGVAWLIARWLTRPLREVREVARTLSERDVDRRPPILERDEVGTVAAALHRMADELRTRLERLRVESGKLEAVISSMQEGVIAAGPAGEILRLNAAAGGLLGLGSEAVGLKVTEAVRHPDLERALAQVLNGGPPANVTLELGSRVVALSLCPIARGRGAVLVARDVTEERRYDELRKEFVANVSHELRTPLTLVQGYLETLREGAWRDEQRGPEFLEIIDKNVRRLGTLVGDLLDLSKLESGGRVVNPRPVDLGRLLEKVRETFAPLAERKRQELRLEPAPPADGFEADPELLERAVSNLVDNAIKYTPEGGRVLLRARAEPGAVSITVEDTGIGIPEADVPRVFERFYRVDKSRSRELGGTGLGLAIVKHVAQLHEGSVEAWSRPGQGSRFTLRLPSRATDNPGVS